MAASKEKESKEFRFFSSYQLQLDFQCSIIQMDLPARVRVGNVSERAAIAGEMCFSEDVVVTAHVVSNQMLMHEVPLSTHMSVFDSRGHSLTWNHVLTFPVKFRDLAWNSMMVVNAYTADKKLVGGTTIKLFDEMGKLKSGKQKLIFYLNQTADGRLVSSTPGELYDLYRDVDYGFKVEKQLEMYRLERASRVEWLDRASLARMEDMHRELTNRGGSEMGGFRGRTCEEFCLSQAERELLNYCTLTVELPSFRFPVLLEETKYSRAGGVASHGRPDLLELEVATQSKDGILSFDTHSLAGRTFVGSCISVFADWDIEADTPAEDKYRKLARDVIRGVADPNIKPNKNEKERLDSILNSTGDNLKADEKDLLWRFRYTLTENRKALTKFLVCVDWSMDNEVQEAITLLQQWKERAPIDVADALKSLGRDRAFQHEAVRAYAVETLEKASDHELLTFLLQLVQALRYEPSPISRSTSTVPVQGIPDVPDIVGTIPDSTDDTYVSPLARFLISRALRSLEVANFLFWYLKVECKDSSHGVLFQSIFDAFLNTMEEEGGETAAMGKSLQAQESYLEKISKCQKDAREEKGRKDQKEEKMRRLLYEQKLQSLPKGIDAVPFPLQPSIMLDGLQLKSTFMFKSAMYPAVVEFYIKEDKEDDHPVEEQVVEEEDPEARQKRIDMSHKKLAKMLGQNETDVGVLVETSNRRTVKVIFKSGDDLRQDQLIMQMIMLMDQLLKKVNLDLKLRTYSILATGEKDGLMEFVSASAPVSKVLADYNQSILNYLRTHNPDPQGPYGISARAMDTFVKSCAGCCVTTFILGIGDRHLDNIMMLPDGTLFHIDFGFIFGRDPKPLPPPFRFTRHMADAMGGEDSEHYQRFKSYCCQSYNWLRKSANLILNLLNLMVDAGIDELSTDPLTTLGRVEEKFRLDLTDEQAEHYFLGLINDTLTALAPRVMEWAHQIAVARR